MYLKQPVIQKPNEMWSYWARCTVSIVSSLCTQYWGWVMKYTPYSQFFFVAQPQEGPLVSGAFSRLDQCESSYCVWTFLSFNATKSEGLKNKCTIHVIGNWHSKNASKLSRACFRQRIFPVEKSKSANVKFIIHQILWLPKEERVLNTLNSPTFSFSSC